MSADFTRGTDVCKKIFEDDFSIKASNQDCEVIQRVCEAVSTRAARLAAAGIVALVKKINKIDCCTAAVDGYLYRQHPKFSKRYYIVLKTEGHLSAVKDCPRTSCVCLTNSHLSNMFVVN